MRWRLRRRRRGLALALTGWLSLSLILTGWPCCELFADTPIPSPPGAADSEHPDPHHHGDHDHDHPAPSPGYAPGTPTDPCLSWLSGVDLAPGALPDVLPSTPTSDPLWAIAADTPVVSVARPRSPLPRASGPPRAWHVPLYLSTARLRI
ncbi:MAG TPA: hypothetical protein VGA00_05290 [Acidiferrobacterales bacterium]|jgi:hypothetical protein